MKSALAAVEVCELGCIGALTYGTSLLVLAKNSSSQLIRGTRDFLLPAPKDSYHHENLDEKVR